MSSRLSPKNSNQSSNRKKKLKFILTATFGSLIIILILMTKFGCNGWHPYPRPKKIKSPVQPKKMIWREKARILHNELIRKAPISMAGLVVNQNRLQPPLVMKVDLLPKQNIIAKIQKVIPLENIELNIISRGKLVNCLTRIGKKWTLERRGKKFVSLNVWPYKPDLSRYISNCYKDESFPITNIRLASSPKNMSIEFITQKLKEVASSISPEDQIESKLLFTSTLQQPGSYWLVLKPAEDFRTSKQIKKFVFLEHPEKVITLNKDDWYSIFKSISGYQGRSAHSHSGEFKGPKEFESVRALMRQKPIPYKLNESTVIQILRELVDQIAANQFY
jgi:hypothetical protein